MAFNPIDYNTGLCDCCMDCCSSVDASYCIVCQLARQHHAITTKTSGMDTCRCILYSCFYPFIPFFACCVRQSLNDTFKIQESGCATCMISLYCYQCSISQMYRELSIRGVWPGGCCVSAPFVHPTIPTQPLQQGPQNQTVVVLSHGNVASPYVVQPAAPIIYGPPAGAVFAPPPGAIILPQQGSGVYTGGVAAPPQNAFQPAPQPQQGYPGAVSAPPPGSIVYGAGTMSAPTPACMDPSS